MGGGALFFELVRLARLGRRRACLSDNNPNLVNAYLGVKQDVEQVIALLQEHKGRHGKDYYYQVRAEVPGTVVERAARIIYLNRTCYNGLYRENSKGQFNVPFGRYTNPRICDEDNLRAVSQALRRAEIQTRHFETVLDRTQPGDLVYFDPPYHPLSKTASFTAYAKGGFDEDAQRRLALVFAELRAKGVKALLSNSKTPFIEQLYRRDGYTVREVFATRAVNSRADRRGKISELLVSSF